MPVQEADLGHSVEEVALSSLSDLSVLEGITGIPFRRQDGVCKKFATEIILQHSTEISRVTATVIPHASRSKASATFFKPTAEHTSVYGLPGQKMVSSSKFR